MEHIKELQTLDTGGGCIVDLLTLADGRVLGISDECVILYPDLDAFHEPTGDEPVIYLV